MSRFRDVSPLVVGHRGGRGDGWPPENTLAAFERATEEGATAIELDVRTARTGEVFVFHDPTLSRMSRGEDTRTIASMSGADVLRAPIGGERIPLLGDVLAWAATRGVSVNVELKHDVSSRIVLAKNVASALRAHRVDVVVSSFDPRLLLAMAAVAHAVPRALLTYKGQKPYARFLREVARPGFLFALHVERTETEASSIRRWKRRGLKVGAWTVNDTREARDVVGLGVDFVITDRPREIAAALQTR